MNQADAVLIRWVQQEIRKGPKQIDVPAELLEHATKEGLREVRALCRLSGVEIRVVA